MEPNRDTNRTDEAYIVLDEDGENWDGTFYVPSDIKLTFSDYIYIIGAIILFIIIMLSMYGSIINIYNLIL